ncbi:DUF3558 family protein [Nocardioides zeae]
MADRTAVTTARTVRFAGVLVTVAAVAALAGCSDDGEASSVPTSSASSFPTTDVREVGDPCEAVSGEEMGELLGLDEPLTAASAGAGNYRGCSYSDADDVVVINTTRYASEAPFDQVFDSLDLGDLAVQDVTVPGADAAGLIVAAEPESLALTAAVAHDGLVDLANFYVVAPYDEAATTAGITTLLERLAAQPSPTP